MFDNLKAGLKLFLELSILIVKKPIFAVPIFLSWLVFASVILYFRYFFEFPDGGSFLLFALMIPFGIVFLLALTMSFTNLMLLEFIHQMERGESPSFWKAAREAFTQDLFKALPITIIWTVIWFFILIIRVLMSNKDNNKKEPSMEDAGRTLSGMNNNPFSWLGLGLDLFEKLVRMVVFLSLPAIAWENKGPGQSFGKAIEIIKKHPGQFLTAYALTEAAAGLIALPLLPIYIMSKLEIPINDTIWLGVIIYSCCIWILNVYFEQMMTAMLYLWHLRWIKKGEKGKITDIPQPNLFDKVYDLKEKNVKG